MPRTIGAKDKKKRKPRSDRKNKSPKKSDSFEPYKSTRNPNDPVMIQIVRRVPMSPEGIKNFNKKVRPKISKIVFKAFMRIDLPAKHLMNKEAIEEFAYNFCPEGVSDIRMFSSAKNKGHRSGRNVCTVHYKIDSTGEPTITLAPTRRLYRYWFWSE